MVKWIIRASAWFGLAMVLFLISMKSLPAMAAFHSAITADETHEFTWTKTISPVTANLNAVEMVSALDGWAAGESGTLLHYDGKNWISESIPVTLTVTALSMSSVDNGWALASDTTQSTPSRTFLHWNGNKWQTVSGPSPAWPSYYRDISVPNDSSAWVAGGILVCSGSPPGCIPEYALGTISHWDGSVWSSTQIDNVTLSSISMVNDQEGWAVGMEVDPTTHEQRSAIWRWNGTIWSSEAHPTIVYPAGEIHYILEEVATLDGTNAWAAVTSLNTFLRWNGSVWSLVNSSVGGRPAIAINSPSDAWGVGDLGVIVHWDGKSWERVESPVGDVLTGISMSSVSEGWAIGRGGLILHGIGFQSYLPHVSKVR